MTDANAHVHGLLELGLTRYEARAYLTLVLRDSYSASELAAEAGIPRQRIYDVLASLVTRGLVRDRAGSVTRFAAVDPAAAIELLVATKRRDLTELHTQAVRLASDIHDSWMRGREQTAPLDYVEVIRDVSLLGVRYHELESASQHSLLGFSKAPYVANHAIGIAATKRIARKGGDVRCIYEQAAVEGPDSAVDVAAFVAAGEQARVTAELPMKLLLSDDSRAIFSLADPVAGGLTSTNLVIEHPALVATMRMAFEDLWRRSKPFRARRG